MKKVSISILLVLILSSILTGCHTKTSTKTNLNQNSLSEQKKLTIGFSIDTLAIERWQRDLDVFINKAKELGADVIVQNAGNNLEEQNRQLTYLLDRNVDVIVVLPKKADGFSETIQKIRNKNIPVIAYDRLILGTEVDLYITINSKAVGELMGNKMRQISKGPNWYCILGAEEDYNMTLVKQGIQDAIIHTPFKIGHTFYADAWNYDLAYNEMVRLISNEDIPDAIICGNDAVADSVLLALNTYYTGPHIPICGQDADIAACQNIVNGKQDFSIFKPITKLAEVTAEIAVRMAKGEDTKDITGGQVINNSAAEIPVLWLEPKLVDITNLDEIVIDSGFHTHAEVYRN